MHIDAMSRTGKARKDAPSRREYRDLVRTARQDIKPDFQLECEFVIRTAGELGLRGGEISHITRDWVDLERGQIRIPSHDPCSCGYCRDQANQAIVRGHTDRTLEEELATRWKPKMEASQRSVPYGWASGMMNLFDRFFHENDRYTHSRGSINRRVDRVAEASMLVEDKNDVYPHALRAHAATNLARMGLSALHLRDFMGWGDYEGALEYVKMAANDLDEELRRISGGRGGGYQFDGEF